MAEEIAMPRLGWTMEEGTLVEWLKTEGEQVETGEILFTVESDKALNEIETFSSGILCIPPGAPQPGDTVPVGTLLGYLLQTGEEMPTERASASGDPASPIPVPATLHNQPTPATKPLSTKVNPTISPRARRIANELNISWHHIKGSGQTGRIIERDIRAVTAQPPGSTGHIRELIANRLWQSQNETAAVTLTTEADATGLVDLRAGFKASQGTDAPTYNHMIAKLTALALGEHPALNASWQNGAPHQYESVHLGLAVDTEGGLLVPVIRDADSKSLAQIATEARALALKARRHTLGPDALQGGTFTISNLGMYGIDAFTPIINLPQAAILGLGRIVEKPAVFQGQVVPRALMALSLTFDHRILDGGPAARFLDRVRTFIEQPDLWWKK
ncbi:MAG: dihydrolipoamide acetyltransferase family protein [Candidatus Latescibacterota bacterium]|nr:dihydrolipoamide acetyltransferase family protein [Candidatus Latescibacterota bacterium]